MYCFSIDQLEDVLSTLGERYRVEGHPPATVDFALRCVRAVLRSHEAAKLRISEQSVDPLPLIEVEEIETEVIE